MVRLSAVLELSVVIPTYNRRDRLARVLSALGRQTAAADRFEAVVVDDGSTDGTSEWLGQQRPAFQLRTLRLTNGGPARARNAGIEAAQGALILFIDDDVEPIPELLQEHLTSHAEADNLVVIGPLASLPHYAQPWVAWEQAKVESQYTAMTRGDWAPTFRQFWTGNASVQKRHLLAAGCFDPAYLRAEDVELGLRLQKLGLGFRFNHRARGLHYAERSLSSWENVCRSYGHNDVTIFGKLGDQHMLGILSASWRKLNPAVRFVVSSCLNRPLRYGAVRSLLRTQLRIAERTRLPVLSEPVCSILASLLYWQAAYDQLGPERARTVLQSS